MERNGKNHRRASWVMAVGIGLAVIIIASILIGSAAAGPRPAAPGDRHHRTPLQGLHLVDYFPAHEGWGSMWSEWSAGRTERDFSRIASLHANGVRVIVNVEAFGFPRIDPVMLKRLRRTIAIARTHGLRTELTLFDGWHEYGRIGASRKWARQLLAAISGRPGVAYIDLQNELTSADEPGALRWARHLLPFVKRHDGGVPVTVSTSISSGVAPLKALIAGLRGERPDLYDVHYYGNPAAAYAILDRARELAGRTPVFVGETGFATDPSYGWAEGLAPGHRSLAAYQAYYFRMVEFAAQAAGLPDASPWILYDMPRQGDTQWGHHMGILHADGARKPAASVLSRIFSGDPPGTDFNNSFEQRGGDPALPTIWRRWLPAEAEFSVDPDVAHSGHASARISDARGDHETGCPAFYAAPIAAVRAGRSYTASAWARSADASGITRVAMVWSDAAGHYLATSTSSPLPAGTVPWQQLSVTAAPPPGAKSLEIDLQVCENPGTSWFDDVALAVHG